MDYVITEAAFKATEGKPPPDGFRRYQARLLPGGRSSRPPGRILIDATDADAARVLANHLLVLEWPVGWRVTEVVLVGAEGVQ